jgi:molybdenum cofactor cytidylyltransferase
MPETDPTISAIIPAAGSSRRMGTSKALLNVGGRPMLVGIVAVLIEGGVGNVTVVLNEELDRRLSGLLPSDRVRSVRNDDRTTTMIDSVRIGLSAAEGGGASPSGYLVCPCDAAGLTTADVRRCVDAFTETPDRIIVATHAGRRGHPILFPASLAEAVRSAECNAGLNHLVRNRPELVREVACESPGTVANVNTPADYEGLNH